jgi:hypothetical protein
LQVAATGVTSIAVVTITAHRSHIENLEVDGQGKSAIRGFDNSGGYTARLIRCTARACTNNGFVLALYPAWLCYATGCAGAPAFSLSNGATVVGCVAAGNSVYGFAVGSHCSAIRCLSVNNTGGTGDGFIVTADGAGLFQCTAWGNAGAGFNLSGSMFNATLTNCLSGQNGGYGYTGSGAQANTLLLHCAAGSNTSGAVNAAALVLPPESLVTLNADPCVNAAGGNYSLNNAAGGGALLKAAGVPGAFPGLSATTSYLDLGAVQSAGGGGGGTKRRVWGN